MTGDPMRYCVNLDGMILKRRKQLAIVMYKVFYGMAPDHVIGIFKNTNDMYSYNLRHFGYNVFIPRPCPGATKRSFHYRGTVLWNNLQIIKLTWGKLETETGAFCFCFFLLSINSRANSLVSRLSPR